MVRCDWKDCGKTHCDLTYLHFLDMLVCEDHLKEARARAASARKNRRDFIYKGEGLDA